MYKSWSIDGKNGKVQFSEGEIVYQTKGIVKEPLFQTEDNKWYIEENGKLLEVMYNPFNGYCYRQDGK